MFNGELLQAQLFPTMAPILYSGGGVGAHNACLRFSGGGMRRNVMISIVEVIISKLALLNTFSSILSMLVETVNIKLPVV